MKNNFPPDNKLYSPLQSFPQEDLRKELSQLIDKRDKILVKIADNSPKEKGRGRQLEKNYNDICDQILVIETQLASLSTSKDSLVTHQLGLLKDNPVTTNSSFSSSLSTYDTSLVSDCRSSSSSSYNSDLSFSSSSPAYDTSLVSDCRSSSSSSYSSNSSLSFSSDTLFASGSSLSSSSSHNFPKTLGEDKYLIKEDKYNNNNNNNPRNDRDQVRNDAAIARSLSDSEEYPRVVSFVSSPLMEEQEERKKKNNLAKFGLSSKTMGSGASFFKGNPKSKPKQAAVTGDSSSLPSAPIDEKNWVLQFKSTLEIETEEWGTIINGFLTQTEWGNNTWYFLRSLLREIARIEHLLLRPATSGADYDKALISWDATKSNILEKLKKKGSDMQELRQKLSNPTLINHDTRNTQHQNMLGR